MDLAQLLKNIDLPGMIKNITSHFSNNSPLIGRENRIEYGYESSKPTPTPEEVYNLIGGKKVKRSPNIVTDYQDKADFPQEYIPAVQKASQTQNIDPNILASLIATETGGLRTPYAPEVSSAGARGMTQIIPTIHYKGAGFPDPISYAQKLDEDPDFAILESARIFADYMKRAEQDYRDALAMYNAGPGGASRGVGYDYADSTLKRAGY